jgi:integrase
MLDRYKEEFHPILAGSSGSRYVFTGVGCRGRGGRKQGAPLNSESLSHIVKQLTGLYVPGEVGFGPHSFRHIVATDIIKKDPRIGFFLAARALHDKLETVENEYIHLKTSEFFEPVIRILLRHGIKSLGSLLQHRVILRRYLASNSSCAYFGTSTIFST